MAYAVAAALMVLKIMGQGWMTVVLMTRFDAGLMSPEDLRQTPFNKNPRPDQLAPHPDVERSRRMHRNDLESIPAFLAAGLIFVTTEPPFWLAVLLFSFFVLARLAHTWAYATAQNHEVRASFYSAGSIVVMFMAIWVLAVALL
ncbi:putative glutathione S-transferase like protein [Rubellimicrobium mesophilum DSM 19309]|uniref:Microsomal glutathione S-transferase 1 n=1 Tax=Rubellimicrobium mesophilum DSM 19309 TaxID=442562 RepID=A0A017HHY1_9RHOB|nr:putative glutathione S-transferase like protein [Rubellimicrobium mesophilum DSM 19309]